MEEKGWVKKGKKQRLENLISFKKSVLQIELE